MLLWFLHTVTIAVVIYHKIMIYLYSLYCALDLYGLPVGTSLYPKNTIPLTFPPSPGHHYFTLAL